MRDNRSGRKANSARDAVQLTPMTRAVRAAMAASMLAVTLGASSGALAAPSVKPVIPVLQPARANLDLTPVFDLTLVPLAIAVTDAGDVVIDNVDVISVSDALDVDAIRGYSTGGDVAIGNAATGALEAVSTGGHAIGIYGYAAAGDVAIDNAADITALSYSGVADAIFASGADVEIGNSGDINALGSSWAAGIEAQGSATTSVLNDGGIYAVASNEAFGLHASGADVSVTNAGSIEVHGYYATGIEVQGYGDVSIDNSGGIIAGMALDGGNFSAALGTGINTTSNAEGATVVVANSGAISAAGAFGGTGISAVASGVGGSASITNSGTVDAIQGSVNGYGAYGLVVSGDADADAVNSGDITATSAGMSIGLTALSFSGTANVSNAGNVVAASTGMSSKAVATGINAFATNGDVMVENTGSAYANGVAKAIAVYAQALVGDVGIDSAAGGEVGFYSWAGRGTGLFGVAMQGDVDIDNDSSISGYSYGQAAGITGVALVGDVNIDNGGGISVVSGNNAALGVFARADNGSAGITSSGDVTAHSGTDAYPGNVAIGLYATSTYGTATITSSGHVTAESGSVAYGASAQGWNVEISNSGSIAAAGTQASVGIVVGGIESSTINNTGTIHAAGGDINIGVLFGNTGSNTLNNGNGGSIGADGALGSTFSILGGNVADTINNAGTITGDVALGGGDDVFENKAGGIVHLAGNMIDLGGSIAGNVFHNAGTLKIEGSDNLIVMASTPTQLLPAAVQATAGTSAGFAPLAIASNALPLVNDGRIDFGDGATDDMLIIAGDLGGNGAIGIDVDLATGSSDQLVVVGNMAAGATQAVDVYITQMPTTAATPSVEFAQIVGDSSAGAFVGGQVRGYSPSNFLDLQVVATQQIDASNAALDHFMVGLEVAGLNDTGTLAATAMTGVANFVNAQMGTFRQRLGFNPYGGAGQVLNAFVRFQTSEGDITPSHMSGNFGNAGNFDFNLSSWGREFGINANFTENLHAGLVFDKADGRQRLNAGAGENRMKGTAVGGYVTWHVPDGWYVDLSTRSMAVDVDAITVSGVTRSGVRTHATSLEAGYEWQLAGFNLVPQLQFVHTKLEAMDAIHGDMVEFLNDASTQTRGRLGLEVSKTLTTGAWNWTPYGSLNLIRVSDGKTTYTAAGNFYGTLNTKGSSAMAELGLSLQKGGLGFGLGLNWTDGGAYNSVVGAQASVHYAW